MSEEVTGAPSGGAAPEGSATSGAAGSDSGSLVSAGDGSAPVTGDDAAGAVAGQAASPAAVSEFLFRGRKFRDQHHAEEVLGSEIERVRGLQRQNAELTQAKTRYESELQALRGLMTERGVPGQGQGVPRGPQGSGGPQSGLEAMLSPERFHFYQKLAEDPEIGLAGAMYAQQQDLVKAVREEMETLKTEAIQPIVQRNESAQAVAKVFGAAKALATSGYPELDDSNKSPEAEEAQTEILSILQELSPAYIRNNPERALRMAVLEYRERNGTPVFATQPGTSGSTSVRAALAAEAAGQGTTPLDGTGTPRPRPGGVESPQERIRRENREVTTQLTTPSGRPLGFSA